MTKIPDERDIAWLLKEKYDGITTSQFEADVLRLASGEPLAYVIGHIPFGNTTIFLDSKPLIPRVETEFWVTEAAKQYHNTSPLHILDLCAGRGCVGILFASLCHTVRVDFVEIDERHHTLIRKNCSFNNLDTTKIRIFGGSLFSSLPAATTYDVILSNPPYIDKSLDRVPSSVTSYEPALALYSEENGTRLIRNIIEGAPHFLTPGGSLWIEHEPEQSDSITKLGAASFLTTTHKDQYNVERYSHLVLQ